MKLKLLKLPKAIESRGDNYLPAGWYIEIDDIGEVEVLLDSVQVAQILRENKTKTWLEIADILNNKLDKILERKNV